MSNVFDIREPRDFEECPYCGDSVIIDEHLLNSGCPNYDQFWIKGILPGATDLNDVIGRLEGFVDDLKVRRNTGWVLDEEDNGYLTMHKPL